MCLDCEPKLFAFLHGMLLFPWQKDVLPSVCCKVQHKELKIVFLCLSQSVGLQFAASETIPGRFICSGMAFCEGFME